MSVDAQRSRPGVSDTEAATKITGERPGLSVLPARDIARALERHTYGVLVTAERVDGRITSQVYASLSAATRKVHATRRRGLRASAVLVELRPVHAAAHGLEALLGGEWA